MMKQRRQVCPKCGHDFSVGNFSRHFNVCNGTYPRLRVDNTYHVTHDGLDCVYCGSTYKNLNALTQHEIRCKKNPNRIAYNNLADYIVNNRKGKTKETCEDIRKASETMSAKYKSGWISPNRGKRHEINYVYGDHNDTEINKWLQYVEFKDVNIPAYDIVSFGKGDKTYNIVGKQQIKINNTIKVLFEHDFVANLYLDGNLQDSNTVHHIDRNPSNNDIHNLLVFKDKSDHARYHASNYAKLFYDSTSHLFTCIVEK